MPLIRKLPFDGRNQQELMIARLRAEPIPLRERRPELDLPEAVEQVLLRAMARDPDARPASTVEFAREFAAAAHPRVGQLEPDQGEKERDGRLDDGHGAGCVLM